MPDPVLPRRRRAGARRVPTATVRGVRVVRAR
ncbi:hypothetical protein JOD57_003443 [Geodermatophilus bullaregiensis]|nr:hypothetical protein [Geodermatophilus bullaregiensis]